ncbi:hypothetical protein OG195_02340 [Streptomyces sp. NBC_01362]|uniref:hypothetical protein n=1 Tax=Streptomyces sp. NBC_01362 TaxID=2903839 RepID=UPI002E336AD5|nr:hypothetical protein [Streptomyces sp. NBC_01362]
MPESQVRSADPLDVIGRGHLQRSEHAQHIVRRLRALAATVPTAFAVYLDRPAVLTPLADRAALLIGEFGARNDVVLDAVLGRTAMEGVLPFDLPSSMAAVEDVPLRDTAAPLFCCGHPHAPRPRTGEAHMNAHAPATPWAAHV